jgi:Ran GTPase-activating protein (RanGAP) involved in mRNA processing and transport
VGRLLEANASIEELDISRNNFGDAGCIALVDGLSRNQGLRVLNLEHCNFGDDGAKQIGHMLESNNHIEILDLTINNNDNNNNMTKEGFEAFGSS